MLYANVDTGPTIGTAPEVEHSSIYLNWGRGTPDKPSKRHKTRRIPGQENRQ
jgi:hypothetical protein